MDKSKSRVLTLVAYYLPGYKAGGPLRTIHNMVLRLSYDFEFLIISRDRDKGDTRSYSDVMIDDWNELDNAMVFYGSKRILNLFGLKSLLRNTHYDIVYLNSFFDPILTFIPLLLRRFSLTPKVTYVIAPRGEFSTGAISLKVVKKRIYMQISKALGLYDGLHWQASSEFEAEDISREFGIQAENIYIAPDLPKMRQTENEVLSKPQVRKPGPLRIVFLSRISPIKNLAYLLRVLKDVTHTVDFTIYGPIENKDYWLMCERLITELPENIRVKYLGDVSPERVNAVFAAYDLFILPTLGENFGHVILEALTAGTPVLTSDQTQWKADNLGGLNILTLKDSSLWSAQITNWAKMGDESLLLRREAAKKIALKILKDKNVLQQNRNLFRKLLTS